MLNSAIAFWSFFRVQTNRWKMKKDLGDLHRLLQVAEHGNRRLGFGDSRRGADSGSRQDSRRRELQALAVKLKASPASIATWLSTSFICFIFFQKFQFFPRYLETIWVLTSQWLGCWSPKSTNGRDAAAALSPQLVSLHDLHSELLLAAAAFMISILGCSWLPLPPCLPSFSPFMISLPEEPMVSEHLRIRNKQLLPYEHSKTHFASLKMLSGAYADVFFLNGFCTCQGDKTLGRTWGRRCLNWRRVCYQLLIAISNRLSRVSNIFVCRKHSQSELALRRWPSRDSYNLDPHPES